jgi:hypothetical protein
MSSVLPRLSALALAFLLVSGCGGGSGGNIGGGGGGGGTSTTVNVTFTGGTPSAVATQIGSGAFTAVSPSGTLTLTLPSGTTTFAVAFLCQGAVYAETDAYQTVEEATTADGTSFTWPCFAPISTGSTGTLSFDVDSSAIPNDSTVEIEALNGDYSSELGLGEPFSFQAPVGSDTVEILAYGGGSVPVSEVLFAAKIFTDQTVPGSLNGGATVVLGPADETTMQSITYSNAPGVASVPESNVVFCPTGAVNSNFCIEDALNATSQFSVLPGSATPTGGTYFVQAADGYQYSGNSGSGNNLVWAATSTSGGAPVALTFPAPWPTFTPTPAALPTLSTAYSGFAGKTDVSQSGSFFWSPTMTSVDVYSMTASENYQNGSISITFPNLSTIPGFLPLPASGASISWFVSVEQGSIPNAAGVPPLNTPIPSVQAVSNSGAYDVP